MLAWIHDDCSGCLFCGIGFVQFWYSWEGMVFVHELVVRLNSALRENGVLFFFNGL